MFELNSEAMIYGTAALWVIGALAYIAITNRELTRRRNEISKLKSKADNLQDISYGLDKALYALHASLGERNTHNSWLQMELYKATVLLSAERMKIRHAIERANTKRPNATVKHMVILLLGEA